MAFYFHTLSLMSGPEMDSQLPKIISEEDKAQPDTGTGSQSGPTTLLDIQETPTHNASIPPYGKSYLFYT